VATYNLALLLLYLHLFLVPLVEYQVSDSRGTRQFVILGVPINAQSDLDPAMELASPLQIFFGPGTIFVKFLLYALGDYLAYTPI